MLQVPSRIRDTHDDQDRETSIFALRHGTRANLRSQAALGAPTALTTAERLAWIAKIERLLDDIEDTLDVFVRVDGLHRAALIYEQQLDDLESAFIVMQAAIYEDPFRSDTRAELERLAREVDGWDELLDSTASGALELGTSAPDRARQLWLFVEEWQTDRGARIDACERALLVRPDDSVALERLAALREEGEEWAEAVDVLARLADAIDDDRRRVELHHRIGRLLRGYLGDDTRAEEQFRRALEIDGTNMAAVEDLAELYREREEWRKAAATLLRAEAHAESAGRKCRLLAAAGQIYREHIDESRAAELFAWVLAIDPGHAAAAEALAELFERAQRWEDLEALLDRLAHRADGGDPAAAAALHARLGRARVALGKRRKALVSLETALSLCPDQRAARREVADLHAALGNWEQVATSLRALTEGAIGDERLKILDELAGIYWKRLGHAEQAIACCDEALGQNPADHRALQRMLELRIERREWGKALNILERFAGLETVALRRGKYLQTAAAICRDELGATSRAVDYLDRALDCFFAADAGVPEADRKACMQPFADIDAILAREGDSAGREAAYLRMIERLEPGDPLLPRLLDALGELYRACMSDLGKAIAAYEAAAELDPECRRRRAIVAELHLAAGPSSVDKAVAQHAAILAREPRDAGSYHALRSIYTDSGQYDKAWCVCAVLTYLDRATQRERQYYSTYRPRALVKSTEPLTGGIWERVRHETADRRTSALLAAVGADIALMRARPHKQFGIQRKTRRDTDGDQLALTRVLEYVARMVEVAVPDLYLQPDEPGELLLANSADRRQLTPSLVARGDALGGRSGRELAYMAARSLTLLRDEHLVKIAFADPAELAASAADAIALARGDQPESKSMAALDAALSTESRARLMAIAEKLGPQCELDVAGWSRGVDLTAQRVGLILSGDLPTAARAVAREETPAGGTRPADLDELLRYAVSEDYFAVRAYLGATIDQIARATRRLVAAA